MDSRNPWGSKLENFGQDGTRQTPVSAELPGQRLTTGQLLVRTENALPHVCEHLDQLDQDAQDIDAIWKPMSVVDSESDNGTVVVMSTDEMIDEVVSNNVVAGIEVVDVDVVV